MKTHDVIIRTATDPEWFGRFHANPWDTYRDFVKFQAHWDDQIDYKLLGLFHLWFSEHSCNKGLFKEKLTFKGKEAA